MMVTEEFKYLCRSSYIQILKYIYTDTYIYIVYICMILYIYIYKWTLFPKHRKQSRIKEETSKTFFIAANYYADHIQYFGGSSGYLKSFAR